MAEAMSHGGVRNDEHGRIDMRPERVKLGLARVSGKGRGLVALERIPSGKVIERAPVLVIPPAPFARLCDRDTGLEPLMARTVIWRQEDENPDQTVGAIAFGLVTYCNHSDRPNAQLTPDRGNDFIELVATKDIPEGCAITIRYKNPSIVEITTW